MNISSVLGLSPLSKYHAEMYGKSIYFNISLAQKDLDFKPIYPNDEMFIESYNWYSRNRDSILKGKLSGSKHQSALRQKILSFVPYII